MKKLIISLVIVINFTVSFFSYGSDSQHTGSGLEEQFDTLLIHSNSGRNLLPLPHLPTHEEMAAQESATSSSSSSATTNTECSAGESPLEQLPLELFKHIREFIPLQHYRLALALASKNLRDRSQAFIQHLAIPISDITEEKLASISAKFKSLNSITIYRSEEDEDDAKEVLDAEKITLLANSFPHITSLNLSNTRLTVAGTETLFQPGIFTSLRKLDVSHNHALGRASTHAFATASFARTLETLNLTDTGIGTNTAQALSQPGLFVSLKELNVSRNSHLGNAGVHILANAPFASILKSLAIASTNLEEAGVRALSQPGVFTSLKVLNLAENCCNDAGITALSNAPFAHQLEELNLAGAHTTAVGVAALAQLHVFTSLKALNLGFNDRIGDTGVAKLLEAPFIHMLESLDLYRTGITSAGVALLAAPNKLTALKKLNLSGNLIGTGIAKLLEAPFTHTLESLDLRESSINSAGVEVLATPGKLTALKKLKLGSNPQIDNTGVAKLLEAPFIHMLESLNLYRTGITSAGVEVLATPGKLTALKSLDLSGNKIGDLGIVALINAPFTHTLESLNLRESGITDNNPTKHICVSKNA